MNTKETARPTVDVSIDFDFFVREDPMWDWGHRDDLFSATVLWTVRYMERDLYKELEIAEHADFHPLDLAEALKSKNIHMRGGLKYAAGIADSHSWAFPFFTGRRGGPPNYLVNIDAHHDIFQDGTTNHVVQAQNWLLHLTEAWEDTNTRFIQLYPRWKDQGIERPSGLYVPPSMVMASWADWGGFREEVNVRHIFLCRSSPWVPPHFDPLFKSMVNLLGAYRRVVELQPLVARTYPTRVEAAALQEQSRRLWEQSREQYRQAREQQQQQQEQAPPAP